MPLLRLAYSTLYLIALVSFFYVWSEVGGQSHLDLLPWWIKLGLGLATAFTVVRAAASAVAGERAWNGQTLKWLSMTVVLGVMSGMATYFAHMYLEETDEGDSTTDSAISQLVSPQCPHWWGQGDTTKRATSPLQAASLHHLERHAEAQL